MSNLEMLLEGCRKADEYEKKKAKEKMPIWVAIILLVLALTAIAVVFIGAIGLSLLLPLIFLRK